GGAEGLSALAGSVAGAESGRGYEGLAREGDAEVTGGADEVTDDLGTAATTGVWLVAGATDGGGLLRRTSGAGRFVATGCRSSWSSWPAICCTASRFGGGGWSARYSRYFCSANARLFTYWCSTMARLSNAEV